MNSALRARVGTAIALGATVIVVLVFLDPAIANVLVAAAVFAAAWEWASFARLTSVPARLAYAVAVSAALVGVEWLARDAGWLEILLRVAAAWWLTAFVWLALRAKS